MKSPVAYRQDLETPEDDETETGQGIQTALHEILDITSENLGHAIRSVHAKGHAYLRGTFEIASGLPPELAQGLFSKSGTYEAIVRISTNPGDLLDDSISVPRGLALKVIGVEGPRLPRSEADRIQDFVMVNGPAFAAPTAKGFLRNLRLLAKTTDRAEWAKKALSAVLRTAESALEAVGGESSALKALGGAPNVHPLGETYHSQTAFRHGEYVAKYSLVPVSPSLTRHHGEIVDTRGEPDAIRMAMNRDAAEAPMEWAFRAQLMRDEATMPVEDATVLWPESESPHVTVASFRADPQQAWTADFDAADDRLRFSVWTGLAAHRPLGVINRVRDDAYRMSADYRARFNRCPIHEPSSAELMPLGERT